jgi:glucan phosphoethanolaminetransferase (alkaline phosphatase superfamily)
MNLKQTLLPHLAAAAAISVLLVVPDFLFALVNPAYRVGWRGDILLVFWVIAILLLGIRSRLAMAAFVTFFGLLQLSQYLHFAYFGSLVAPQEVALLFYEWQEIWHTLSGIGGYVSWPLVFVLVCAAAIAWLWLKTRARHVRIPLASLWLLLLLGLFPLKAYMSPTAKNFYPNPKTYALKNTLYAFSYFLGRDLPQRLAGGNRLNMSKYQPYVLKQLPLAKPINIVIVMGESLGYRHMSLFGYGRETTPRLEALRTDPNFIYRTAISGGVATKVSLPTFFNILREPDNLRHVVGYETNLLKMAREQGLKTHFLSVQTSNLTTYAGVEFADHYITQEDILPLFQERKDDALLSLLGDIDLSASNFIVLHQRCSHSPYDSSYPASYTKYPPVRDNFKQHMVNTYDNSIRYTDHILSEIIQQLKQRGSGPTYLFFTSDHGEMMGEDGKFGHSLLEPGVAEVPLIFYAQGGDPRVIEQVRKLDVPTHYEIAKLIAGLLGYEFRNPNERPGVFYINGPDLDMSTSYLIVDKQPGSEKAWRTRRFDADMAH